MIKIGQSKLKTMLRCRRQFYYKYFLKLERRRVSRPLAFGSLAHQMIELEAEGENPFDALEEARKKELPRLLAAQRDEYEDILDDLRVIMTEYFEYWDPDPVQPVRFNRRSVEHYFEIELAPDITWAGTVDMISRTPDRLRWLSEHKTFGKAWSEDDRWRNLQSATYMRAIDILGWPAVDGMFWNYIHSKSPSRPQKLKGGEFSAKNIVTLPLAVREAVEADGQDPDDYPELMDKAKARRSEWFIRVFHPVKKSVVDMIFDGFVRAASRMRSLYELEDIEDFDMVIDKHCSWCEYESLCRARLTGGDEDYVRQKEFRTLEEEPGRKGPDPQAQGSS